MKAIVLFENSSLNYFALLTWKSRNSVEYRYKTKTFRYQDIPITRVLSQFKGKFCPLCLLYYWFLRIRKFSTKEKKMKEKSFGLCPFFNVSRILLFVAIFFQVRWLCARNFGGISQISLIFLLSWFRIMRTNYFILFIHSIILSCQQKSL